MKRRKKLKTRRVGGWEQRMPDAAQAARYAAKEAQKQREIVDVVLRLVITNPRDPDVGSVMEIETTMERGRLAELQQANDQARVWINYVREQ